MKSGHGDQPGRAADQIRKAQDAFALGAKDPAVVALIADGTDITQRVNLGSGGSAARFTVGGAGKEFDRDLGITADQVDQLADELVAAELATRVPSGAETDGDGK